MFGKKTFINKNILIYGLGLSGKSCLRFLSDKNKITIFDDNEYLKNKENKNFFLDIKRINEFKFDYIVLSPGIDIKRCKL